jgi:hypothetical protein
MMSTDRAWKPRVHFLDFAHDLIDPDVVRSDRSQVVWHVNLGKPPIIRVPGKSRWTPLFEGDVVVFSSTHRDRVFDSIRFVGQEAAILRHVDGETWHEVWAPLMTVGDMGVGGGRVGSPPDFPISIIEMADHKNKSMRELYEYPFDVVMEWRDAAMGGGGGNGGDEGDTNTTNKTTNTTRGGSFFDSLSTNESPAVMDWRFDSGRDDDDGGGDGDNGTGRRRRRRRRRRPFFDAFFSNDEDAHSEYWANAKARPARRRGPPTSDPWEFSLGECVWIATVVIPSDSEGGEDEADTTKDRGSGEEL